MTYYTVLERETAQDPWAIAFGSFEFDDATFEAGELEYRDMQTCIFTTPDEDPIVIGEIVDGYNKHILTSTFTPTDPEMVPDPVSDSDSDSDSDPSEYIRTPVDLTKKEIHHIRDVLYDNVTTAPADSYSSSQVEWIQDIMDRLKAAL